MDVAKLRELIRDGERINVDFKIVCNAFASTGIAAKAELAKDICAMANNGPTASYLIVGVSDDGTQFRNVTNDKLTDANLQSFCKTAISPPPRVGLHKLRLPTGRDGSNVELVVIQIGPQRRQAFSIGMNFINFKEQVCHRRNEVWVRRGTTSDLATPDEIRRLSLGMKPTDEVDPVRGAEQERYRKLSIPEKEAEARPAVTAALLEMGFQPVPDGHSMMRHFAHGGGASVWTYWKIDNGALGVAYTLGVEPKLDSSHWRWLSWPDAYYPGSAAIKLADAIDASTSKTVKRIRTIAILVSLSRVTPAARARYLSEFRKSEDGHHYYLPQSYSDRRKSGRRNTRTVTTELILIDAVASVPDLTLELQEAMRQALTESVS